MAEPALENPIAQPQEDADPKPNGPSDDSIQPDPLLDSGAFICASRDEYEQAPHVEFKPGEVINAVPISMVAPEDILDEATPKPAVRKSNAEERPSWLPENWSFYVKVRASGASAGTTDRYYVDPSGKRRFRSKNEVLSYVETGEKPKKRRSASEAEAKPSGNSATPKQKKSSTKGKKPEGSKSEVLTPEVK